jgi:hypothetical protein
MAFIICLGEQVAVLHGRRGAFIDRQAILVLSISCENL